MIGKLPKPERDKIALYCFNRRMRRNENKRNINRATPCADRGGGAVHDEPASCNEHSYCGPLTVSNGIYHPCRVDVRGAK